MPERSLRIFFETFMLQNYGTSMITCQGPSASVGWTSDLFLCPSLSLSPLCLSLFVLVISLEMRGDEAPLPLIKIRLTSHYTRLTLISYIIANFSCTWNDCKSTTTFKILIVQRLSLKLMTMFGLCQFHCYLTRGCESGHLSLPLCIQGRGRKKDGCLSQQGAAIHSRGCSLKRPVALMGFTLV